MLTALLAHQGGPQGLHDLWARWNADPLIIFGLATAMWTYRRGARRSRLHDSLRARCFSMGLAAVVVALVSPLDSLAAELASAHMVQHVLLLLVAAPLLAYSAPTTTILAGLPRSARRRLALVRHRLRGATAVEMLRRPTVAWLLHAATLWFWHAAVPYDAALGHPVVHALEHATFIGTGVLFWSTLLPSRAASSHGYGALLVFTMAMQSVFLAALLTFASRPWYAGYDQTTQAWGLDPLADQQLAGVIMWVPAGLVYVAVGVLLVTASVRDSLTRTADGGLDDDWGARVAPGEATLTQLQ